MIFPRKSTKVRKTPWGSFAHLAPYAEKRRGFDGAPNPTVADSLQKLKTLWGSFELLFCSSAPQTHTHSEQNCLDYERLRARLDHDLPSNHASTACKMKRFCTRFARSRKTVQLQLTITQQLRNRWPNQRRA